MTILYFCDLHVYKKLKKRKFKIKAKLLRNLDLIWLLHFVIEKRKDTPVDLIFPYFSLFLILLTVILLYKNKRAKQTG